MKTRYFPVLLSVLCLMLGAPPALAASAAVQEMAAIMLHLEHYPSEEEKGSLKAIVTDKASTESERAIATAIMHLQHRVAAGDVDGLKRVMNDMSAPAEVRDLAGIVLNINHKPSAADIGKLKMMAK